ncbi:MAG: thioredoxin family protein [Saprospiraceae bacterium]|nr:thioredoxin family protein [Candidatus Vicinibacter affinis]MBP6172036.1 thioredoxin family protein [Saprospiraceae bacterium]MBK7301886.1 thioredoxin family protein [Candidatus Vicinibacter affinis]MBK7693024.1 thioredoxin family protein [Candidatus Vicinibacter affinis]MBK7797827.1 thioredoxin family protein [Candidatus Vicinibacter affinis]
MSYKESNMIELGTKIPEFSLLEVQNNEKITITTDFQCNGILIMFICNHCPFVIHVLPEIVKIARDYSPKGIKIIAISSNDVNKYPEDSPYKMKELSQKWKFNFPYCYDEDQKVAQAFEAACTPDFYLFDDKLRLVYRGRMDESRPGNNIPLTGSDLRSAMDQILLGKKLLGDQFPSAGCNIKWKP